jgi:hypothetical protein
MGSKQSAFLSDEQHRAWKASGLTLADVIRRATFAIVTWWLLTIAGHAAPGPDRTSARLDLVRTGLAARGGAAAAVGLMLDFRRQHQQESPRFWLTLMPPSSGSRSYTVDMPRVPWWFL